MAQIRYTFKTKGSRTVVRMRGWRGIPVTGSGTSNPPYEEIKHILDRYAHLTIKPKAKKKRRG